MPQNAENSKTTALNTGDSRRLLKKFGVPVVPEESVDRQSDMIPAAQKFGFPVVVKGIGKSLLHKTDRGLVHINLPDSRAVENAARAIEMRLVRSWKAFWFSRISAGGANLWSVYSRIVNSGR